jgi:hypothetical protein
MVPQQQESVRQWWCSIANSHPKERRKERKVLAIAGMRSLWLERNARTFDRESTNLQRLVARTLAEVDLWASAKMKAGRREE